MAQALLKSYWSSGSLIFEKIGTTATTGINFGIDGTGIDIKFFGDTASSYMLWDQSADALVFDAADIKMGDGDFIALGDSSDVTMNFDGTNFEIESAAAATNLLIGADSYVFNTTLKGTFTVGKNDTGHDVKFFGATSGKYMLWDEAADKLIVLGTADLGTSLEADAYTVGGTAGADFSSGAVSNIHVIKGIVVYAA